MLSFALILLTSQLYNMLSSSIVSVHCAEANIGGIRMRMRYKYASTLEMLTLYRRTQNYCVVKLLSIVDIDLHKESREQVLRHLCIMKRKMPISLLQTPQTSTIHGKRLLLGPFMPNRKAHKHQVHHITHAVKRKVNVFLPNGVEAVVLDHPRAIGDGAGRCRRG